MTGTDPAAIDGQPLHWRTTFQPNPSMYGLAPSEPALHALERFQHQHVKDVLELGAGQGQCWGSPG